MTKLIIVGAGEFGRELLEWVRSSPSFIAAHDISEIAFLDDTPDLHLSGAPLFGSIQAHEPASDAVYLCAVSNPSVRERIVTKLEHDGARFVSFIHDSVIMGAGVTLGVGSVICPGSIITVDVSIGKQVHVNLACTIGHDVVIDDYATLSPSCNLTGGVVLEKGVFLGTAVTIIPGKRIGAGSKVGAGSVVLRRIGPAVTAFGNPCRVLGPVPR